MRRRFPRPVSASVLDCSRRSRFARSSSAWVAANCRVQGRDALRHHQPGLDGEGVHRLGQVVVGARVHPLEHVLGVVEPGGQDDVDVPAVELLADPTAQLRSVDARHHPVGEEDVDAPLAQQLPGQGPVLGHQAFVAELGRPWP